VRSFLKKWYIKPVLLTPTNLYQYQRSPFFSWTPVPGASFYRFEYSTVPNFGSYIENTTTSNTFYAANPTAGSSTKYWRITPYDGNGRPGVPSNTASFVTVGDSLVVHQTYPLYYYTPDNYPPPFNGITTNPHEDRTVALPIFIWTKVYDVVNGNITTYPEAYRLQVDDDPLFGNIDWTVDTQNTVAVPTASNPFVP
jgi:hypothetical protein